MEFQTNISLSGHAFPKDMKPVNTNDNNCHLCLPD